MTDVKSQAFFLPTSCRTAIASPHAAGRFWRFRKISGASICRKRHCGALPRWCFADRYRALAITPRAIRLPAFPAVIAVSTSSWSSEPVGGM